MQKDMVPAEAVMDPELEHRLAPVVAGQKLASAVIQDTVKYLGIQATGISNLNGPYLQVRPAGDDASDILLVGSWRAHFPPGGDGSGPVLDSLQPARPKQSPTALLRQASESDAAQSIQAAPSRTAETSSIHPSLLTTPAVVAAAAVAASGELGPKGPQAQAPGAAYVQAYPASASPEVMQVDYQLRHHTAPPNAATELHVLPGKQEGPVIEEYYSDSEAASPGAVALLPEQHQQRHAHHGRHDHGHHHQHHCSKPSHEEQAAQGALPVVQLAASLETDPTDPDRMMEDTPAPQHARQQVLQGAGGQQLWKPNRGPVGGKQGALEGALGKNLQYAHVEGPGLAVAGALASAAAMRAAAAGSPRSAAVVTFPGPLVLSPRPRSEWELDPAKIAIGRRLAVGGFGEVFVAKYEGTLVAVKRLLTTDSDTTQRFVDEVHMLARLRHPNLLLFMGFTLTPEPSIITEFMARGSLFHILRHVGNRPPELRMQRAVALAVARGMAYLHSRAPPILHLDLKSPNVLVDDRWRVKIADFGLSRVRQRTYVSSGAAAGSPEWMAPEVLRCDHYSEPADVYSFGVILWELLTGQAPWADLNAMQVVGAVGFARRSLPDPVEGDAVLLHLCKACRAYEPTQRPTFSQIVESLESHLNLQAISAGSAPAAIAGAEAGATAPAGSQPGAAEAGSVRLPALPAPEPTAMTSPAERTTQTGPPPAEGRGGVAASAPVDVDEASAATRITRRHSLAASPDASDLLATAATGAGGGGGSGGSFSTGGGAPRLNARFASVHESPRSRRRYRSPRGEDMVGPPAITARLQDGRKTPSPRTSGGWPWQGAAEARADAQPPAVQPQGQPAGGAGVRLMPANASPFAAAAATDFGPDSIRNLRKLRVDSVRSNASGSDGGSIGSGAREVGGDGPATAEPQSMDIGSPTALMVSPPQFAMGMPPDPLPSQLGAALPVGLELPKMPLSDAAVGGPQLAAVAAAPQVSGQTSPELSGRPQGQPQDKSPHDHPQEAIHHRHQEQSQPVDSRDQVPWQAEQRLPRQTGQQQAQPPAGLEQHSQKVEQQQLQEQQQQQQEQVYESASLTRQLLSGRMNGQPGHRRVSSDEANHGHRMHAALNGSMATGVSGAAAAAAAALASQSQHPQHQQRLLAAAPASGAGSGSGGAPPLQVRRSRGLARNSAPMRYTYGGASGGAAAAQQMHQLQSPPRPRSLHWPNNVATMHQQVLTANAEAAIAAAAHGQYPQLHPGALTPATPGGGGNGSTSGLAALSAPMSLSPLFDGAGLFSEAGGPRAAELRDRDLAAAGSAAGGGADPWPDTHSELSFAFNLRDNVSVCSDDYMQCASLDRLPLLEENEMTDPVGDDDVDAITEGDAPATAAGAEATERAPDGGKDEYGAVAKAETDFELPRPYLSDEQPSQRQLGSAKPVSPFAVEAAARPPPPWAPSAAAQDTASVPEADLWAALQTHGSGALVRGSADHYLSSQANGSPLQMHRTSGGSSGGGGCDAMQPGCSLPHSRQSSDGSRGSGSQELAVSKADGDQAPKTHPRMPNGGGATTYRSGRFKVTIEPACSDPPPVQHPSLPQLNQNPQQPSPRGEGQSLQHCRSLHKSRNVEGVTEGGLGYCADCSVGAGGCAPATGLDRGDASTWPSPPPCGLSNGGVLAAAPALQDPISMEQAATAALSPVDAFAGGSAGGNNSGYASPHGSGPGPAALSPLGESPNGTCGRLRNGHHGHHTHGHLHGELAAGPPVALNSITMYRKGRFFVSHAAAGTHSLYVTNPNATAACPATGCGGSSACTGVGGYGGFSATESMADESEEHEAASGPPSPFACAAAAAAPFGRVCSQTGMDGSAASVPAAKQTWAAVVAMTATHDLSRQGSLSKQYSRGRFTVAESIVTVPSVDSRRPSSTSAGGDPPVTMADLWPPKQPCPAATPAGVSAASLPHESPAGAAVALAAFDDPRSRVGLLKPQQLAPTPALSRMAPLQASRLQVVTLGGDAASAPMAAAQSSPGVGSAGGGGSGGGCGGSAASTAPASPKAENMVVRRIGRFTVREVDGGANASSRGPSSSGTPTDAPPRGDLHTAGQTVVGVLQGLTSSARGGSGGGAAGHGHGSPPEETMVPSSHHSSWSFASASGCSRSSSASHGLDGDLLQPPPAVALPQPQDTWTSQPSPHRAPQGPQQPGVEPHALKVLRVKSKGRFTVTDYEAPPPPPPLLQEQQQQQPAASAFPVAWQPGESCCGMAGPARDGPLQEWAPQAATAAPPQPGAAAAAVDSSGAATCAGQPSEPTAQQAAGFGSSLELDADTTRQGGVGLGTPHGGVLHPPSVSVLTSAGQQSEVLPAAAAMAAAALPGQAPWGMSGPQAPEQRAQLQADMERLVRERMERNAADQQRQELEPGGRQRVGRTALRQAQARPLPPLAAQQQEVREGHLDDGEGNDMGDRCTYEVSFGDGLTIQISHGLQADGDMAEEGEEGEDEDAVMVDVGIVHGDVGEAGGSDGDSEAEGQQGDGRDGVDSDDELQRLQPPETPAHEPAHEREPASWEPARDDAGGGRHGRRQRRRHGAYGSGGSSDCEDSMEF